MSMTSIHFYAELGVTPVQSSGSSLADAKSVPTRDGTKLVGGTPLADFFHSIHSTISRIQTGVYVLLPRVHLFLNFMQNIVRTRFVCFGNDFRVPVFNIIPWARPSDSAVVYDEDRLYVP